MKCLLFFLIISFGVLTSCSTSLVSKESTEKEITDTKLSDNNKEAIKKPALYKVFYKSKN